MPGIVTGIPPLDEMLFGDSYYAGDRQRGFTPGQVVLIRGEPGSGKTTLGLQSLRWIEPRSN